MDPGQGEVPGRTLAEDLGFTNPTQAMNIVETLIKGRTGQTALVAIWICLAAAFASPAHANAAKPQVVCITEYGQSGDYGKYRRRPHGCQFNAHGAFPVAAVSLTTTRSVHWSHWGQRSAIGRGQILISTYGPAPIKLWLSRPRFICGHRVFTRLRTLVKDLGRTYRDKKAITSCLT